MDLISKLQNTFEGIKNIFRPISETPFSLSNKIKDNEQKDIEQFNKEIKQKHNLSEQGTLLSNKELYDKDKLQSLLPISDEERKEIAATIFGEALGEKQEGRTMILNSMVNQALKKNSKIKDILTTSEYNAYQNSNLYNKAIDYLNGNKKSINEREKKSLNNILRLLSKIESGQLSKITDNRYYLNPKTASDLTYFNQGDRNKDIKIGNHISWDYGDEK